MRLHYLRLGLPSLLIAIGLEAFNKFSQEEKEKMEREQKFKKEQKKKAKLTGRFLIKGVVDILSDTFASTEVWVRLKIFNYAMESSSNLATLGTCQSVLIRGVASFQGWLCTVHSGLPPILPECPG